MFESPFPLKEVYILLYSKSSMKVFKLHSRKRLGMNICNLVICINILELDRTFLHHIMYELIHILCVLRLVMKYRIHWHLRTTLVISVNHGWLWNLANNPVRSLRSQTAFLDAELAVIYSTSAVLRATEFCFLLYQEITAELKLKTTSSNALLICSASEPIWVYNPLQY